MTSPTFAVKETAKTILKGNYYRCILATLIPVFSSLILALTSSVIGIVFGDILAYVLLAVMNIFVVLPMFLGLFRFFRRLMWNEKDNIISVFHYLGNKEVYKKAIKHCLVFILRLLSIGILVYLPSILIALLSSGQIYELLNVDMPEIFRSLAEAQTIITTISTAIFIFFALKYYLTPFLLVADEDMDIGEALYMSKVISRKSTLDFAGLFFGMSFWILVSVFLVPLPFTLPYIILAYMVHCRFAVARYNKVADLENNPPFYSPNI